MKEISIETLRDIQLEILCTVDKFCRINKLNYSLAYGTLLGAVRHKGFIPWDDDIDILMPRKDYDEFVRIFKDTKCTVITHKKCNKYILPYAKVYFNQSILIDAFMPNLKIGINIDVFPVDNFTDDKKLRKGYIIKRKIWNNVFLLKNLDFRWRGIIKTVFLFVCKSILFPLPKGYVCNKLIKHSQEFNNSHCSHSGVLAPADFNINETTDTDIFSHYIELPFENYKFYCVCDYDKYLRGLYGEYMQLPPKEKQVSHHRFKAYMK